VGLGGLTVVVDCRWCEGGGDDRGGEVMVVLPGHNRSPSAVLHMWYFDRKLVLEILVSGNRKTGFGWI
jgi:hypothetical protein